MKERTPVFLKASLGSFTWANETHVGMSTRTRFEEEAQFFLPR